MSRKTPNAETYLGEYRRYVIGLIGTLVLMYIAYFAATNRWFTGYVLAALLLGLAAVQFIVQLIVFLHIDKERKPRWTQWSIVYTLVMMVIIVVASLWIMTNMNYNMMVTPDQMQQYMMEQNKKGF